MAFAPYESNNLKNKKYALALNFELEQLDKAKKAELRMQNTAKQRFRAKYGSHGDIKTNQAGDVRMYQTHNPGFCYHRDGQPRESDTAAKAVEVDWTDYQEIMKLLLTNGELDVRKVLCLHALSSHPCESLKPPSRCRQLVAMGSRAKSALEQLIRRSNNVQGRTPPTVAVLPTYILNVNQNKSKPSRGYDQNRYSNDCCIRDGRLATRFVINDKIAQLVHAVLEALQRSNPRKLSHLVRMAQNRNNVKEIFNCAELKTFLASLSDYRILLNSDSYFLTRPFLNADHVKIVNPSQILVRLVNKIRSNVLKDSINIELTDKIQDIFEEEFENKYSFSEYNMDRKESEPVVEKKYCPRPRGFNAERMSTLLCNKIREAQERDMKQLKKSLARNSSTAVSDSTTEHQHSSFSRPSVFERLHCSATVLPKKSDGRTACSACEEKYMKDLFPSKRPNEKTSETLPSFNIDSFKNIVSKSTQWLNYRINEEVEKLRSERIATKKQRQMMRKFAKEVPTKKNMILNNEYRRSSYMLRKAKNYAQYYGHKVADSSHVVNNLNLAKIKHEISVKENSKRVKKFLDEPLF